MVVRSSRFEKRRNDSQNVFNICQDDFFTTYFLALLKNNDMDVLEICRLNASGDMQAFSRTSHFYLKLISK